MALVAICMVAILGMALLSIDAVRLYLVREEAQRAADAAALAGVRILSLSGMTGDPNNAGTGSWTPACNAATAVATAVAQQNAIAGQFLPTAQITVTFPNDAGCASDPGSIFGVNPEITVKVSRQNLPSFFGGYWGTRQNMVTASATAEAFNPSGSGAFPNGLVPVQPRCTKPWIVPNKDPGNSGNTFVSATGTLTNPGIKQLGGGVIGESFNLSSVCNNTTGPGCNIMTGHNPPTYSATSLDDIPAFVQGAPKAVSSCATADPYSQAIGGCDQATVYACGAATPIAQADLTINPVVSGDNYNASQCLIHGGSGGQDTLTAASPGSTIYPFQIWAGFENPLVQNATGVNTSNPITSSSSIATIPIYDDAVLTGSQPYVNIVGFLQVFINSVAANGDPNVTVLNVSGCGNAATNTAVTGTSPVPIRLITAP